MRPPIRAALLAVGLAACEKTPCERVAGLVCEIPGESESCTFLRSLRSNNELAQRTCTDLEPAARSYAANPGSLLEKGKWLVARAALGAAGWVGAQAATEPKDKLNEAGEDARKAVDQASQALQKAGGAIEDALRDAVR